MHQYEINSVETIVLKINKDVRDMKRELNKLKKEVNSWKDPAEAKQLLKFYQIPKEDPMDFF
jgi:predicted  nucleic acid-binding Zn-ribbon protein